jgi:hypothetical protein
MPASHSPAVVASAPKCISFAIHDTDGYKEDLFPKEILQLLTDSVKQRREIFLTECDEKNNLLHYCQRIWVPNYEPFQYHLLQQDHDVPTIGHSGRLKTFKYLCQNYTWHKM